MKKYLNFDLEINRHKGIDVKTRTYHAKVIHSPDGEGVCEFRFPFKPSQLNEYLHCFANTRGVIFPHTPKTSIHASPRQVALEIEAFGSTLFDAVFQQDVASLFRSSLKTAQQQQAGIRLRLRLADAPELINIPWEYLFDRRTNTYLSLADETSVIRYMALPLAKKKLQVSSTINILVVISNPCDYAALNTDLEKQQLDQSLASLVQTGDIHISYLENITMNGLTDALNNDDFHIIHFIGHGSFDTRTQEGSLIFEDEHKNGCKVTGKQLANALQNEPSLRLIVLNSCEGGITSNSNIFSGVAQSLVKKEIPAVLAMQYEITDKAAIVFSQKLYTALAKGEPIDTALSRARQGIYHIPNELEFGTAALYMRAEKGKLFGKKSDKGAWQHETQELALSTEQNTARLVVISMLFVVSVVCAYGIYLGLR